jgi:O-antigen/teichoic acid export membrane protein
MTVEKQVLAALKWTSLAKLVGQVISWGVTLVVLRLLLPADYGLMAIVSMIITLLAGIAELGLGVSLVQAPQLTRHDLSAMTGAVIVLNSSIGALVVLLAPLAAWFYAEPRLTLLIQCASLHFLLNALGTIPQALASREMNFRWLAWVELVAVVTSGLATLGLAWDGYGVWALLLGSLVQNFIRTAVLLLRGMPRPVFRREGLRRHVTFGGTFSATRLVTQVVYQSDIFIAGILLSQQAIGLYSVSLHLATLPMQKIMGVINQVTLPAVAKLQNDRERLRLRMLEATRLLTVFSLPVLWGMSAVAPEFVAAIMGPKWAGAVFLLQAVCLVLPMRMLNIVYTTATLGVGAMWVNVVNTTASAILLPLAFYIGGHWGVDGLALAWVVAIPCVSFFRLPKMLQTVDIRPSDLVVCLRAPAVAGASMYAAVGLARLVCEGLTPAIRLAPLIVVGAGVYIGTVLLLDRGIARDILRVVRAGS